MKILLIFAVYLISSQMSGQVDCDDVTGYEGGSVLISCKHDFPNNMNRTVYFCKLDNKKTCIEKYLSDKPTAAIPDQKIFIMGENPPGFYSVLIKNISKQDKGTYRCGVENGNKFTDVKLEVKGDTCCGKSFPHKAHPGETVAFTCRYPAEFQKHFKYMYKVTDHSLNLVIYLLGSSSQNGRFSISDHEQENLFNVSISDVTLEDAGVYLCGVQWTKDEKTKPYFSLFNEMQLQVTSTVTTPDSPGSSATVIAVSICVVLLLIGGVALIFYKLRQIKPQDSASAASTRRNVVNGEETHQGPYYEEIPDAQPSSSTVYATAQKPKSPSKTQTAANRATEPPTDFYSMAQLSNPATGSSAEYATVDECT